MRFSERWVLGAGTSIALHVGAAAAVLFTVAPAPTSIAPPAEALMTIELAPTPSAPVAPLRQTAPGPVRVEATPPPMPAEPPKISPPPKLLMPIKADIVLPIKPRPHPPRPVRKPQAEQTTAPQALVAPPKPVAASPTQGASSIVSNAAQSWENGLLARLERVKRYPGAAQAQSQEDLVYVRITIDRSGKLTDAQVVRSRGYALLDREVVAMAHRASPFPAPPAEEHDPVVVVVPVEFFIGSQSAAN